MTPGPQTRSLNETEIHALKKFRNERHDGAPCGYSLPQLRLAMSAPFGWRTLQKALLGIPVLELHHTYIVRWIAENLSSSPARKIRDGKSAAAGEPPEPAGDVEPDVPAAAPIRRGSR
jgi:hypothetical protein